MSRSRTGVEATGTIILLAIGAVVLLFSLAILGMARQIWEQDRIVTGGAKEAPGVVGDHGSLAQTDLVRYEVDGHVYEIQAKPLRGRFRRAGDTVTVLYRPEQPQLARVSSPFEQYGLPGIVAGFGLVMFGVGLVPIAMIFFPGPWRSTRDA